MSETISALRGDGYSGLSYDGGRTSTPYAIWVEGEVIHWTADVRLAWVKLREEVVGRGIGVEIVQGRLVFTE